MYGFGKSSQVKLSKGMSVMILFLSFSGWAHLAITPATPVVLIQVGNQRRLTTTPSVIVPTTALSQKLTMSNSSLTRRRGGEVQLLLVGVQLQDPTLDLVTGKELPLQVLQRNVKSIIG